MGRYRDIIGDKNPNWRGGVAEYKNHALMKKLRLQKLREEHFKCQVCGNKASQIHHINNDKSDQRLENFMILCRECHFQKFHRKDVGRRKTNIGKCLIENCNSPQRVKHLCSKHYSQIQKFGQIRVYKPRTVKEGKYKYNHTPWTTEQDEILIELVKSSKQKGEMTKILRRTRSAILGRIRYIYGYYIGSQNIQKGANQ